MYVLEVAAPCAIELFESLPAVIPLNTVGWIFLLPESDFLQALVNKAQSDAQLLSQVSITPKCTKRKVNVLIQIELKH